MDREGMDVSFAEMAACVSGRLKCKLAGVVLTLLVEFSHSVTCFLVITGAVHDHIREDCVGVNESHSRERKNCQNG